ncbi:MAG: YwiC-like family protein [Acidimicrobiia bacterium]
MSTASDSTFAPARPRAAWRSVAIPDEHGGWGLTAEPVLLGLLVAPSWPGLLLAVAAFVAFMARSPLKIVLVDRWRRRRLRRTRLAARIAIAELAALVALATAAGVFAGWAWAAPAALALPLVGIELWFDMRSRSRRLLPEVCGAVGIASVAASIVLAGGDGAQLAAALWLLLAARAIASIPFVRVQIGRLRDKARTVRTSDRAQFAGAAVAAVAVSVDRRVALGTVAVAALLVAQVVWVRRPPVPAKVLGMRQLFLGVAVVAITALSVAV